MTSDLSRTKPEAALHSLAEQLFLPAVPKCACGAVADSRNGMCDWCYRDCRGSFTFDRPGDDE